MSDSLRPHGLQYSRFPCPSPTPGACSYSCPSSQWCHPTISSSIIPFSCLQSFPASGSFPISQFFASGGQSIWVSLVKGMADHFSILALRTPWTEWKKLFYFFINGMGSPIRWQASHSWECLSRVAEEGSGKGGKLSWMTLKAIIMWKFALVKWSIQLLHFLILNAILLIRVFFSPIEIIGSTNLIILLEDEIFADFFNTFLSLPVSILRPKSKCFINSQIVNITELSAFFKNK